MSWHHSFLFLRRLLLQHTADGCSRSSQCQLPLLLRYARCCGQQSSRVLQAMHPGLGLSTLEAHNHHTCAGRDKLLRMRHNSPTVC